MNLNDVISFIEQEEFADALVPCYADKKYRFPVEIKDAGEKGRGVFATRNIKKGDVCCWYDGVKMPRGNGKQSDSSLAIILTGEIGYNQLCENNSRIIAGFMNQFRPGGCAQLCNDASTDYKQTDMKYWKKINVKDAETPDGCFCFVATKRIKKGEELLYNYGEQYWRNKHARERAGVTFMDIVENISMLNNVPKMLSKDYFLSLEHHDIDAYRTRLVVVKALLGMGLMKQAGIEDEWLNQYNEVYTVMNNVAKH